MGKQTYVVERSATMQAPARVVFDLIVDFHHWRQWSPWEDLDPKLYRNYFGPESGVGATYEWAGNRKAGAGRMEVTNAVGPSHVEVALQFLKPFKSLNTTTFDIDESSGSTRVTWRMVGPKTFATRLMGVFMSMDKMIGGDFEKGLARLATAAQA